MARTRSLKAAATDPLVKKKPGTQNDTASGDDPRPVGRRIGRAVIVAAVIVGFIGGWMARKYLRLP
jgi:hypothetical protein